MTKDKTDASSLAASSRAASGSTPGASPGASRASLAREASSVEALFRDHADDVARWASRLCGPTLEAEDVVQEVFMIAHKRMSSFRGEAQPRTWLFSITKNVVRHRRRNERVRRFFMGDAEQQEPPQAAEPSRWLEQREAARTVYGALEGLAEKYREAFILFEIEGLSGAEICSLTGRNPSTLRVHLMRARALFLKRLEGMGLGPVTIPRRNDATETAGWKSLRTLFSGRAGSTRKATRRGRRSTARRR